MLAEAEGDAGDEAALALVEQLRLVQPAEADALLGRLRWRQGRFPEATDALVAAFERYRSDPWPLPAIMGRAMAVAIDVADKHAPSAARLYAALGTRFAVSGLEHQRLRARVKMLQAVGFEQSCAQAIAPFEPDVPWEREFLALRLRCYEAARHPLAARARADFDDFLAREPTAFGRGLVEARAGTRPPG